MKIAYIFPIKKAQKGGIPISNALTITERTRIAYDEKGS